MTEMIKAVLNGEFEITLPKHRADRPEWYTDEGWEKKRLRSMSEHIGKGDVVYYIGAELGEMPALCQMWGAEVVLIEPNHMAWPVMRAVWEANNLRSPLKCFAGFASSDTKLKPEKPDLALFEGNGWEIQPDGWPKYSQGEIVTAHGFSELYLEADGLPQIRIDDLDTKPPTVITFDVEGSEWEVLKGAEETLKKYKPKIWASIHPEFMYGQYKQYSRDFRNWIIGLGYTEEILDYQHELHCLYT